MNNLHLKRRSRAFCLTMVAVALAVVAFAVTLHFNPAPVSAEPQTRPRLNRLANLVRGYIAVAAGRSGRTGVTAAGLPRQIPKDVFLPGVEVYLEDPQTGKLSKPDRTDLSGRFSVYAPGRGRYRICWTSPVYGKGCTPVYVSAGSGAQFLSTVRINIPLRKDYVAITGNVTDGEGGSPRTYDPLLNINAFATVNFDAAKGDRAKVYVNNFGDYFLPYVPIKQDIKLSAVIEGGRFTQEIFRAAQIERSALHRINMRIQNTRPRIDPLIAVDAGNKRVQNPAPGTEVSLMATARDNDGDPVKFSWVVDASEGQLSQNTGPQVKWKLPNVPGRYSVTAVAYDEKGGYDKAVLSLLVGAKGIPFTGIVVEPSGLPVKVAQVEIVGNPTLTTDDNGRFATNVNEADRYVVNVRKAGYALNSQVFERAVTGGRWILRRAQVVTINPTRDTTITHKRSERDCPGPDSVRANLGAAGKSLMPPQWQDGKGRVIDPPYSSGDISSGRPANQRSRSRLVGRDQLTRPLIIMPRQLKLRRCGPGMSVRIPAGSVLDTSGNPATTPFQVTISTVDLLSPQQMPGDDSVIDRGGNGGNLESFGAGALDLPAGFKLKSGATARVTIPVDRSRLLGEPLPPSVPFLSYDEKRGLWIEEGTLNLMMVAGVRSYVGDAKHFSPVNADNVKNNTAACLRVFSPGLPANYDLEVSAPLGGTGAPKIVKKPIVNTSPFEHVVYNLPNNVNITLAPMTQGANPQLLGFFIVNSGPPQNPNNSPDVPPLEANGYTSCQNFVNLNVGSAPSSPFGGEFLHGLGFIDAANLGFDDLTSADPTGNALKDAIVDASRNYYLSVDPNNLRTTFADFKSHHGFPANPNAAAPGQTVAQYANSGDLGFGRDMHCLKNGNDVACYVTNYGNGYTSVPPGGGTDDQDDANAAGQRNTVGASAEGATVAMEYSAIENDPSNERVVKFFVYKPGLPDYGRSISANLDGRGERPVPQLCMVCHGGQIPSQSGGVPAFNTADQVKLDSRFIPFDYRLFTFPTVPGNLSIAQQDAEFKILNEEIVNSAPPALASDPIREVVTSLYNNGASSTQLHDATPPGWVNGASANAPNQVTFYRKVIAPACRICHASQPFSQLQFNNSDKFLNLAQFNPGTIGGAANRLMLGTAQLRVCGDYVMPHALRTHDIFWDVYWDVLSWGPPPSMRTDFQTFGDGVPSGGTSTWKPQLCTTFISGNPSVPSEFFQHTIQPIFNGKCVGCHIQGGIAPFSLTEGDAYNNLVPGMVAEGNDDPAAAGNTLLFRTTHVNPVSRMPPNCFRAPEPPNGNLPCLSQTDIDKLKAWIRNGAN